MSSPAGISKALGLIRALPRVSLSNLKPHPSVTKLKKRRRGMHGGIKCGRGNKGQGQRNTLNPIGYEGGNTPFYLLIPKEPYYKDFHLRRQYPPVSLLQLQRMIDLGRVDPNEPIDLTALCNTKVFVMDPAEGHYGVNLTDEGADIFQAKVNIEVQWTNEVTIAAIEKNGGVITTKFYDKPSVQAMADPIHFFNKGVPVPRCKLPPEDAIRYYSDPQNRGYLADPDAIQDARIELAQKFGYVLPDITKDEHFSMLARRKDPRQIWFGLEPGWVVNMRDKTVLKPTHEQLKEYYRA